MGSPPTTFPSSEGLRAGPVHKQHDQTLDFDQTLGFPGEGPLAPRNRQDVERREARASQGLPDGRPVLQRTSKNRAVLITSFFQWLSSLGVAEAAFDAWSAEEVSNSLSRYGRDLFEAGLPYWHFSETINAVSSRRPSVRCQMQGAWDVAFGWLALEPHTHRARRYALP